jgi:hypothetical protein
MHTLAIVLVGAAILAVPVYLLSGLFGPRQPENLNLNAPEPSEAEFSTQE